MKYSIYILCGDSGNSEMMVLLFRDQTAKQVTGFLQSREKAAHLYSVRERGAVNIIAGDTWLAEE